MTMVYRIRGFRDEFETNESRKLKHLPWIALPTKQEGDGYTELMSGHNNGCAHFGAWTAVLQLAAKCSPRGTLVRDLGGRKVPHDVSSISRITRVPVEVLKEAIPRLIEMGWIEVLDVAKACDDLPESAGNPAEGGKKPGAQERTAQERDSTGQHSTGEGQDTPPAPPAPPDQVLPPEVNPSPQEQKRQKRRLDLLVILKAANVKLEMGGENIFMEWIDETDGYRLDLIEHLLSTVRPRIKLPSKLRIALKGIPREPKANQTAQNVTQMPLAGKSQQVAP